MPDGGGHCDDIFTCRFCLQHNVVIDPKSGIVCSDCGAVLDFCVLVSAYSSNVLDGMLPDIKKKTYKHIFYWNERMAQFRMEEPLIPEDHVVRLADSYIQLVRDGEIKGGCTLQKGDVKKVIVHSGLPTSKYLEKYLSISYILTGIMPYKEKPSLDLIGRMSEDFIALVSLFEMNNRFGRHSMINYNLLIRQLLLRHGGEEYVHLFPELKTRSKLNKAMEIYDDMWMQILESQIISTLGCIRSREDRLKNAGLDKSEIVPRITSRVHLKRKYASIGDRDTAKHRRLSRGEADNALHCHMRGSLRLPEAEGQDKETGIQEGSTGPVHIRAQ